MDPSRLPELEALLKRLANVNRLRLLITLQEPKRLGEIQLTPTRSQRWGTDERAISRQAVRGHLKSLEEIGAVSRVDDKSEEREAGYVVNHARLFELTQQLRAIATVRPDVELDADTLEMQATGRPGRHEGPHLVLVRGVREGHVFPLDPPGPPAGWTVGRATEREVCLDYDPYVSSHQCTLVLREGQHFLADHAEATNRTFLNWREMIEGGIAPLVSGDIIGAGMSLLVYRD